MASRKTDKFFITFSKFNRGSMTIEEINLVVNHFKHGNPTYYDQVFIVNEHKNKKKEAFEHLHIFVKVNLELRTDKLRDKMKATFSFIQHQKDIDVRQAVCVEQLLAGYMMKTDDFDILLNVGITDEFLNECKNYVEANNDFYNEKVKKFNINRISIFDQPYIMFEYIQEKQIDYDLSLNAFKRVIRLMILDKYDLIIDKGLTGVKAKLDLLISPSDGFVMLDAVIDNQFLFLDHQFDCKDGYKTGKNFVINRETENKIDLKTI